MKNVRKIFPLSLLLPQLAIGIIPLNTLAQQPQVNVRKEHLEYCVNQLPVEVGQLKAIQGVMSQENLTPFNKLESISQILSPQQKETLKQCMEKPMPQ